MSRKITRAYNPKFTIKLNGWDSYLKCEEHGDKRGNLQAFFYNWYNKDHSLIMKFHNHTHEKYPDAADEVTEFDPVHLQFPLVGVPLLHRVSLPITNGLTK
ncbi:hypothetical protein [Paenibacillus tepidiphilus]|uniref:hypothetical protein n=1 Tax=Paenibacillus tepidiphilus TaxID=2608683 RepID=UPI0012387F0A|nr:hypothetical protein [Paenibacillus tepidiphilus]